ncbi:MAG: iron uptake porin, partial [Cyanobacteria bacterium P01_H01_bin.150]
MNQYLKQIISFRKLLAVSLIGYGIFSQLCFPSEAVSEPKLKKSNYQNDLSLELRSQSLKVKGQNLKLITNSSPSSPSSPFLKIAQQTSVDELSDVKPTDWAYQALKSLIERYDVKLGLPDGTFRGNRAVTRYEFAAGLAATLDKVNELIATTNDKYILQDRITLRRLEKEYRQALQDLRTRLNDIDSRSSELQENQFSTTTKLKGQQIVGLT